MAKQTKKRKALNATLSGFRGTVKFLQPYYLQGGKWHKLKTDRRVKYV